MDFKGKLTEADTLTIRLVATPSRLTSAHLHHPPHIFYRPDALPAAQPIALKATLSGIDTHEESPISVVTELNVSYAVFH